MLFKRSWDAYCSDGIKRRSLRCSLFIFRHVVTAQNQNPTVAILVQRGEPYDAYGGHRDVTNVTHSLLLHFFFLATVAVPVGPS